MLFAPDRCVFKITVFSCVVVSVFSDGRMGFYRAGWRCCVAGCMACGRGAFCLPVCFRGPGGFFFRWGVVSGAVVVCGIRRGTVCGFGAGMRVCYGFVRLR